MPQHLPIPTELQHLLEKRGKNDRRSKDRQNHAAAAVNTGRKDQRSNRDRRRSAR